MVSARMPRRDATRERQPAGAAPAGRTIMRGKWGRLGVRMAFRQHAKLEHTLAAAPGNAFTPLTCREPKAPENND